MSSAPTRVVFHDRDAAEAVAEHLAGLGHAAQVRRDRFQGEDDDEDHSWEVLVDGASSALLEGLAEEHDGWVDPGHDVATVPRTAPELPTGPRRFKRPPRTSG